MCIIRVYKYKALDNYNILIYGITYYVDCLRTGLTILLFINIFGILLRFVDLI